MDIDFMDIKLAHFKRKNNKKIEERTKIISSNDIEIIYKKLKNYNFKLIKDIWNWFTNIE